MMKRVKWFVLAAITFTLVPLLSFSVKAEGEKQDKGYLYQNDISKTLYKDILDKYYLAISQHWDGEELLNANLCFLCREYNETSEIGYAFIDINGDGIDELFIGQSSSEGWFEDIIFDMYTIIDNQIVQVLSSRERDRYYLCSDYIIANEGSNGASNSCYSYYYFDNASLSLIKSVIYDSWEDMDNPWFYSTTGHSKDCGISISEKEAFQIINSHSYINLIFTPFSQFL